jgi:hypothetical protein
MESRIQVAGSDRVRCYSGLQVRTGSNAIVGCGNDVLLPGDITDYLRNFGRSALQRIVDPQ